MGSGNIEGYELYKDYEEEIKHKNRFFLSDKYSKIFEHLWGEPSNFEAIKAGTTLYRARINKPGEHF